MLSIIPSICSFLLLSSLALAQSNGCVDGYTAGTDTVIFTTPYTYAQVISIIGSFKNITWSGSPYNSVTLNGTDNTVGTARTYDIDGAHVVETITVYSKPANGPYDEVHTLNNITIPSLNLSLYGDYDGTTVVEVCDGLASKFNFTINFCATNATLAAAALHQIHLTDAMTVGVFLGGMNFTSCDALENNSTSSGMASATAMPTGAASSSASVTSSAGASASSVVSAASSAVASSSSAAASGTGAAVGNAGMVSLWSVLGLGISAIGFGMI